MKARFAGKCHACGKAIEIGQEITWNRAIRGSTRHVECSVFGIGTSIKDDTIAKLESAHRAIADAHIVTPASASIREKIDTMDRLIAKGCFSGDDLIKAQEHRDSFVEKVKEPMTEYRKAKSDSTLADIPQNAAWYEILPNILQHVSRVLLVGPPATGKSTTAMKVANCKYRVTMTETTSREDLIGMFHLIDGETKWIDGPISSAMRNGETVLVDEIDRYSPEAASLLYALIDDKPHLSLPNGDMLYAAQGYKMIMTSNEGLDSLPVAVQDRIEVILMAAEPHKDAISDLPQAMQNVTTYYYRALPKCQVKLPTTVRRMRTLNHLLVNGMHSKLAATIVFGQSAEILSVLASAENAIAATQAYEKANSDSPSF